MIPVRLTEEDFQLYYNGCCNATFWPLFHSMPDRWDIIIIVIIVIIGIIITIAIKIVLLIITTRTVLNVSDNDDVQHD